MLWGRSEMIEKKVEYFAHLTIGALGIVAFAYLFFRYVFFAISPFLIGWTVAFCVRPVAARLAELTRLSRRTVSAIIGTVSVLSLLTLAVGIVIYAGSEAWDFISSLGERGDIFNKIEEFFKPLDALFEGSELAERLGAQISEAVKGAISKLAGGIVSFLSAFFSEIPRVVIFIIISSLATVYFCLDLELVNGAVKSVLPRKIGHWLSKFKSEFFIFLLRYLRSYLALAFITFIVMIFGFMIMKIPFAVFLAFLVALVDLLPLLGVGAVLVPWGVFELVAGSHGRGIGLLILFLVSWLLRQATEAKIVGKSLGLHPLLSLAMLYIGYSFFGFWGLFLVPPVVVALQSVLRKKSICPPSKSGSSESET